MRTESEFWARMFGVDALPSCPPMAEVLDRIEIPGTLENQVVDHLAYFAVLLESGSRLFRVRSGCEGSASSCSPHHDLGPNPSHPASRANTGGQYAMYLSELERTATAEVRLPVGSSISVGEFTVSREVTIVDLCQSFKLPNPFATASLSWMLDLSNLLRQVATTIAKPMATPQDYVTTQLLANIARARYDGLRYPSACNQGGRNVVLFRRDIVSLCSRWVSALTP